MHAELINMFNQLDLNSMQDALQKHDEWFMTNEDPDIKELRDLLDDNDRDSIIKWILWTDPILTEGGLMHFVMEKVKPLLHKSNCEGNQTNA